MKILFVLGGSAFFRFVDGIVRELAGGGHQVDVLSRSGVSPAMTRCAADVPAVSVAAFGEEPYVLKRWISLARHLRTYRHWLEPEHRWSEFLRRRWATTEFGFPSSLRGAVRLLGLKRFDALLQRLPAKALLEGCERRCPPNPRIVRWLRQSAPDLVVATPVIYPSPRRFTTEVEFLKAAQRLGLPTAVLVASWDNLSMKGMFYVEPDLTLVWNEIQVREAVEFHGLAREQVVATGAPLFDPWFDGRFAETREEFLNRSGLRARERYALYVESSLASGNEWGVVHQLATALDRRGSPPELRVVVRRHPGRRDPWQPLEHPRLVLYPARAVLPDTEQTRRDYYSSIAHASAIVGINTTVFLEAAILDRPCISILTEEKAHFQSGLLHFHYLLDAGFLELASTPEAAAEHLSEICAGGDRNRGPRRRFVESFLRPAGRQLSAARIAAETLLRMPARRLESQKSSAPARLASGLRSGAPRAASRGVEA